jgi:DNA-directed RNA polymerase specialized sigma24 family protein
VKRYRDVAFDGTYLDSLPPEINFEAIYRLNKLNSLSEEQKTILRLHLQGYSHKEIGAQLNISEENARKRSERARKAFCKEIDCPEQYCQKKDCSKD